jgi:hypothetical protein
MGQGPQLAEHLASGQGYGRRRPWVVSAGECSLRRGDAGGRTSPCTVIEPPLLPELVAEIRPEAVSSCASEGLGEGALGS